MIKRLCCMLVSATALLAQTGAFELTIDKPAPYTRTFIGNGYLGMATSPLGTTPVDSFLAGLYETADGDVPRLAGLPAWNEVNWFDGRAWLNDTPPDAGSLRDYRQTLNMRDGLLRTEYRWQDQDRATSVVVEVFISRLNPHLAVLRFQVTPHRAGPVRVTFSLSGRPEPRRLALARLETVDPKITQQEEWYPGHMVIDDQCTDRNRDGGFLCMTSHPEGAAQPVAEAAALSWPVDLPGMTMKRVASLGRASVELTFEAVADTTYAFYKYVAAVRSAAANQASAKAQSVSQAAATRGYDAVLRESADAWHTLWETDIVVDATLEFQRLVHSMLFYLLSSTREDSDSSIPPMGLSTAGYYGHVFWDADTFMFPALMVLHPELAKPIVMFRYRTLEAAKANARRNGFKGAMYPWEAGPDGSETTPRFAWQNATSEIHVNGDVALAQWQYYLATGDRTWLATYGYPVIRETAEFWVSRVKFNHEHGRYEIPNVVSWIESQIGVNNDAYTNAAAAKNLELATKAANLLGETPNPDWEKIGRKLYVPEGATLLVSYPLERRVSLDAKQKELDDAFRQFGAGEFSVMMGTTFYPILAVEAHDLRRLDQVLPYTYKPYLMPAFNVLREVPDNTNINFLTGAGGFLQQFVFGYPGLRFSDEGLTQRYTPMLPTGIRKLTLKNITIRGGKRDVVVGE
jgi:trehalose/maltose hydrolase-like predicted phosphorylase